ncbi:MAG: DUF6029 family protein [Reichenbachiella sp.]|uniref:DUF6029 family protein n=1 Tax=Reichenbachiella sp. TaxID=2184521 RepID=UPI0032661F2F
MNKYLLVLLIIGGSTVFSSQVVGQSFGQEVGQLSGGFESTSQFYKNDETINAQKPDQGLGTNNYFKLDYSIGQFTFGVRYEAYLPPLLGYPEELNQKGVVNRFATYQNEVLRVTAGNFYEQFGAGLILRAYEERLLGIDNSIDGIHVQVTPKPGIELTGLYGVQRDNFEEGEGQVRGLDVVLELNELLPINGLTIRPGWSLVSKYQEYTGPDESFPEVVDAYSYRLALSGTTYSVDAEYVDKSSDPSVANAFSEEKGSALLVNAGYAGSGIGINGTFRRIENSEMRSDRTASINRLWMNYLPAETRQHGYLLANIYPYNAQALGEIGGQLDITYKFARESMLGGKYGTKVALNFSQYHGLKTDDNGENTDFFGFGEEKYYQDFNVEFAKKLSRKLKLTLTYINQKYNKEQVEGVPSDLIETQIGVIEILQKLASRKSIRLEVQHLWTDQDMKNWAAGLIEFNMAPNWSFYLLDQFNYGGTDEVHYYQAGLAYMKGSTRIGANYGRQRGGLLCVGGVCRFVPAATGLSVSVSTTF